MLVNRPSDPFVIVGSILRYDNPFANAEVSRPMSDHLKQQHDIVIAVIVGIRHESLAVVHHPRRFGPFRIAFIQAPQQIKKTAAGHQRRKVGVRIYTRIIFSRNSGQADLHVLVEHGYTVC